MLFLREAFVDESNEMQISCEVLPKLLTVKQGIGKFHDTPPDTPSRAINVGETIRFRILDAYPQLVFPEEWQIAGEMLTINESSTLGVRVPEVNANLFLEISLKYSAMNQGKLVIRDGNEECTSVPVKNFDTIQCRIPVRMTGNGIAELRFEFVPMLRNRAPAPKIQRLKIESITLRAE